MENEYHIVGKVFITFVKAQILWCDEFRKYIEIIDYDTCIRNKELEI